MQTTIDWISTNVQMPTDAYYTLFLRQYRKEKNLVLCVGYYLSNQHCWNDESMLEEDGAPIDISEEEVLYWTMMPEFVEQN